MKYLTQEWYQAQKQAMFDGGFLHANKRAAQFDEALFQKLYEKCEKQWASALRSAFFEQDEEQFEETMKKIEDILSSGKATDEEKEKLEAFRKDSIAMRETATVSEGKCSEIDDERAHSSFAGRYETMLKTVDAFPREILSQVADKRLLALGYVTAENKKKIEAFARAQGKRAERLWEQAANAIDEAEKRMECPVGLNEYATGVMDGIESTERGVALKFGDIPDILVLGGEIVKREYPVHSYALDTDPLSPMTLMLGKELEYVDGKYRLSLFLENVDECERATAWELVVEGSGIEIGE